MDFEKMNDCQKIRVEIGDLLTECQRVYAAVGVKDLGAFDDRLAFLLLTLSKTIEKAYDASSYESA